MTVMEHDPSTPMTARVEMLLRFVLQDLQVSVDELSSLRDAIDAELGRRAGDPAAPSGKRTLYLPGEPLDEL